MLLLALKLKTCWHFDVYIAMVKVAPLKVKYQLAGQPTIINLSLDIRLD